MEHFQKRPRCQGMASSNDNRQQRNDATNEEQIELDMLTFKRVLCSINIGNSKSYPILLLYLKMGMGNFFANFLKNNTHMLT
jgi:hypothetical protein